MIARRRHRLTLQKNTPTTVKGVNTDVWTDMGTVYGHIRTMRGVERERGSQKESVTTHEIRMRYRSSLAASLWAYIGGGSFSFIGGGEMQFLFGGTEMLARYRVKFGSKYFEVRSVLQPDPRRLYTVMRVEEVVT